MRKRIVGLLLSLVLTVSMMPMDVLAVGPDAETTTTETESQAEEEASSEENDAETEEEEAAGQDAAEQEETDGQQVSGGDIEPEDEEPVEEEPVIDEDLEEEEDDLFGAETEYIVNGLKYTINGGNAVISGYDSKTLGAAVVIPTEEIINGQNYIIRSIGSSAFKGNTTMTSVVIPETISTIGANAFRDCSNLSNITIKGNIADCHSYSTDDWNWRDRDYSVFSGVGSNAASLTVTFAPGVTRIPARLFATVHKEGDGIYAHVTDIVISDTVTEIGQSAFQCCYDIKSITMGSGLVTIGANAFKDNSKLNTVTMGTSVREIGEAAFANNTGLVTVNCNTGLNNISSGAFEGCTGLKNLNLGTTLASIGSKAFKNCTGLETLVIPQSVTALGTNAFRDCTSLNNITFNGNVADCHSYSTDDWNGRDREHSVFSGAGSNAASLKVTFAAGVTRIPARLFATAHKEGDNIYPHVTEVVIGDTVKEIGDAAFLRCYDLKSITMGSSLATIGNNAFAYNTKLTTVTMGAAVKEIGEAAFYGDTGLVTINCNTGLNLISTSAFEECTGLKNLSLGTTVASIGSKAFKNCTGLETLVIPQSVTALGTNAFRDCTGLSNITFNGNVADCHSYSTDDWNWRDRDYSVFSGAGSNAASLKVTFTAGVTRIPARLFATAHKEGDNIYPHVTEVVIGDTVKEIGEAAFLRCYDLKSITMGSSLATIGKNAFAYNTKLTTVTMGAAVKEIGEAAFYGDTALVTVNCNAGLNLISTSAFEECTGLKNLNLGTTVASIGSKAFKNCTGLETVVIPQSVTALGTNAFRSCTGLQNLTINGNIADCSSYSVDTWNWRDRDHSVFSGAGSNANAFNVTFGPAVTRIPAYLFATAHGEGDNVYARITNVVIPESVKEIGKYAFSHCFALTSVSVASEKTTVSDKAFDSCNANLKFRCYYGSPVDTYAQTNNYGCIYWPPKTPELVSVENAEKGVQVSWKAAVGAKGYYVYRNTGSGNFTLVGTVDSPNGLKFVDTKAKSGSSYRYAVKAFTSASNTSEYSNYKFIRCLGKPTITSIENGAKGVEIKWKKVSGATGYTVYRRKGNGSFAKLKDITSVNTTTFTDTKASVGVTYTYKVVANYKKGKDVSYSIDATKKHVYLKSMTISGLQNKSKKTMSIKWKKVSGVTGYQIEYALKKTFAGSKSVKVVGASKTSKDIKNLAKKTYYVRIRSYKTVGKETFYSPWSATKSVKIKK